MGVLIVQHGDTATEHADTFYAGNIVHREEAPHPGLEIDDEYASHWHALFSPRLDGWTVEDAGSTNGTWLNGEKIYGARKLAKGDKVRIGRTELTVVPT